MEDEVELLLDQTAEENMEGFSASETENDEIKRFSVSSQEEEADNIPELMWWESTETILLKQNCQSHIFSVSVPPKKKAKITEASSLNSHKKERKSMN